MTPFARLVRQVRSDLGWTQQQLADESGIGVRTIIRWENSQGGDPELGQLQALIAATGVPAEDVLRAVGVLPDPDVVDGVKSSDPGEAELSRLLRRIDMPEADRQLLMTIYRQRRDARDEAGASSRT